MADDVGECLFQGDEREGEWEGTSASTAKKSRKLGMSFTSAACLYDWFPRRVKFTDAQTHLPLIYQLFVPFLSFDPWQQLNKQKSNTKIRFDPTPILLMHSHGSSFYQSFNLVIHPLQQIHF